MLVGWGAALLVDPRVRLRKSGYGGPLFLIGYSALLSEIVNNGRITELNVSADVVKGLMFLFSFLLVFVLIVSVVRREEEIDFLLKALVGGGAIVAVFSLIERATHFNVFNHMSSVIPLLQLDSGDLLTSLSLERGGRLRVYASAQHPIALGALLVMLLPLAIYLARKTGRSRWWVCTGLLGVAAVATVSRTSVVMLAVVALVLLRLRPVEARRMAPILVCGLVAVPIAAPGALGTLRSSFFPKGGLVEQQQLHPGTRGSGRLADVGPSLDEWSAKPFFGEGYSTRIVDGVRANAPILDDQWLKTLLETGVLGVARLDLAVRPWNQAHVARRTGRPLTAGIALRGDRRLALRLRGRDVLLRRVLVHPSHVCRVHPARPGRGRRAAGRPRAAFSPAAS